MTHDKYNAMFMCDECGNKRKGGDPELKNWSQTRQEPFKHYCSLHYYLGECNMMTGIAVPHNPVIARDGEGPSITINNTIVTNEKGGMQSAIPTSLYKLDPDAILALGQVLAYGANKYHDNGIAIGNENWRLIPHTDHLDHTLEHILMYMRERKRYRLGLPPDENDEDRGEHLEHALCRLMFALATEHLYEQETHDAQERNAREKASA